MNTITLTIVATPDNLRALSKAFEMGIDDYLIEEQIPAKVTSADIRMSGSCAPTEIPTQSKIAAVLIEPVEKEEPEKEEAAPVEKEAPKEEAAPAEKESAKPAVTKTDLRDMGIALMKAGKTEELAKALAEFGVERVTMLSEDQYDAFAARLEEIK